MNNEFSPTVFFLSPFITSDIIISVCRQRCVTTQKHVHIYHHKKCFLFLFFQSYLKKNIFIFHKNTKKHKQYDTYKCVINEYKSISAFSFLCVLKKADSPRKNAQITTLKSSYTAKLFICIKRNSC